MKWITPLAAIVLVMTALPANSSAACPKDVQQKLREHRVKAEEALLAKYDYFTSLEHALAWLKLDGGKCGTVDHRYRMHVIAGVSYFYNRNRPKAREQFLEAVRIKDQDLPKEFAAPVVVRFYESVRAEYHQELAKKKAKQEQIRRLEAATGMPPEPEENPKMPIEHTPRTEGFRGRKFLIFCRLRDDILAKADRVEAYVDVAGDGTYKKFVMKKMGKRRFVLLLPGENTSVPKLRYYILAVTKDGTPLAASGNSGMPHVVDMKIPPQVEEGEAETEEAKAAPEPEKKATEAGKKTLEAPKKVKQEMEEEPTEDEEELPEIFQKKKEEGRKAWDSGVVPMLRFGLRLGTGIGWITGHTEVYKTELNSGLSPAPIQVGFTVAAMISRLWSVGIDIDMGLSPTESDLYDKAANRGVENDGFVTTSMRSDMRILVRVRKFSVPQDLNEKIRWRWYWEAGLGGGWMRHMAPGEDAKGSSVADTDYTSGAMVTAGAGAVYCVTDTCNFSVLAGANYTGTYSMDPDNSSFLHLDLFVGTEYLF